MVNHHFEPPIWENMFFLFQAFILSKPKIEIDVLKRDMHCKICNSVRNHLPFNCTYQRGLTCNTARLLP